MKIVTQIYEMIMVILICQSEVVNNELKHIISRANWSENLDMFHSVIKYLSPAIRRNSKWNQRGHIINTSFNNYDKINLINEHIRSKNRNSLETEDNIQL